MNVRTPGHRNLAQPRRTSVRGPASAEGGVHAGHVDFPGHRDAVLRRAVRRLHDLPPPMARCVSPGQPRTKWYLGGINTAVLLLSSFCMAMAVHAGVDGIQRGIIRYLVLTILVGGDFPGDQGDGVLHRVSRASGARAELFITTAARAGLRIGDSAFDRFEQWFADQAACRATPRGTPDRRTKSFSCSSIS